MPSLELRTCQVGPWNMNTYALVCRETGAAVLIDPGDDPERLAEMLVGSRPMAILLTHTHPDHIGALHAMRERLGVPVYAHPGPYWKDQELPVDRTLADGDRFPIGLGAVLVCAAPGHTPDQLCFVLEDDRRVVVGDVIFEGGPGRTWSAADFQLTLETLRRVVLAWPDETVCYPGHGPAFRLGDIRSAVEAFVARDHGDFFGDATWA